MTKTTLSSLKNLVKSGAATELKSTGKKNLKVIQISKGTCGINGALLKDSKTGKLYAITSRGSVLFYYV